MKVHFITSRPSLENDIETLRIIVDLIKDSGHTLVSNWIEEAYARQTGNVSQSADWAEIVRLNIEDIAKTDVLIAETSYENFAVGYQIAMAIQQKKPILLLRHASADKNAFVTGIEDGWVKHAEYSNDNLTQIIADFMKDNDIQSKDMRFNFFIDREIYNYLRWAAFKTGKTKAEILRELVKHEIDSKDYQP